MDARQTNSAHGVDPRAHQPWPYPEQHRTNSAAPTPSWVPTSMPHIPANTPKGPHVPHMAESHDASIPAHPHDNVFQRPIFTNPFDDTAAPNPQTPNDGSGRKYDETSHAPIPVDPGVANSAHFTQGLSSSNDWFAYPNPSYPQPHPVVYHQRRYPPPAPYYSYYPRPNPAPPTLSFGAPQAFSVPTAIHHFRRDNSDDAGLVRTPRSRPSSSKPYSDARRPRRTNADPHTADKGNISNWTMTPTENGYTISFHVIFPEGTRN